MKPTAWLFCLLPLLACPSLQAAAAKQIASYDISARLDPQAKAVEGSEVLSWLNDSPDQIRELQFHLYMNAFKNQKSTAVREFRGFTQGYPFEKDSWGYIDVRKLRIVDGPDLTKAIRFIHPDDSNADDRTVISVALPVPVNPGSTIRLAIDFYTKLPQVFARTGYRQNFYLVAQWFPKIGVWEKAGERYAVIGAWNCHQFHANSEFYADFGTYNVEITVPSRFVVGATGVLSHRRDNAVDGTTTYHFSQADVHDFAWTASPVFHRLERTFHGSGAVTVQEAADMAQMLGISPEQLRLNDVQMILLIQPEHMAQVERHFKAIENGLKYYGLWYGAYPYQTITVVDPPYGASGAGGMEYPTFITAGTSWPLYEDEPGPEGVTVHEFGHQYWYGMVANNEFEEAWLDEGINSYSTSRVLAAAYPPVRVPVPLLNLPLARVLGTPLFKWIGADRAEYLALPKSDNIVRDAWDFYSFASYAVNSYARSAVTLQTLERLLGTPLMSRVMRTYFERWKYRHPTTRDFVQVANEVSGRNLNWFFDQFLYGSNLLDYRVGSVDCHKAAPAQGIFDNARGHFTVDRDQARRIEKKAKAESYNCEVKIQRNGEAVYPVRVQVRFKNGETIERPWDGQYRWTKFEFARTAEIESVAIDPGYDVLLDASFANNSRASRLQSAPLAKWTENLLFWFQNLLIAVSAVS